ncbi:hypothetical protein J5226_12200 [Lysobacter sp. K5869]|uniref:hypothetical protein n=1 Tax=Lysobacter sp. K5869 TaxID=2820808 RepID=UPI001C05FD9B|nr:hypothetical protein [Lysobacter sp. K5869]QWP79093.1 hypothetical protein J5226_12200 [Lysobacter sp. K5869]
MTSIGRILFAFLIASSLSMSPAASAQKRLQLYNAGAWVDTGTVSYSGQVTLSSGGIVMPCISDWTLTLTNGAGSFSGMTQSGSISCAGTVAQHLPWPTSQSEYNGVNPPFAGAPTLPAPLHLIRIGGVRLSAPAPLNTDCPSSFSTATINAYMDSSGAIVFKSALGPCGFQTAPNQKLVPNVPVRAVW